MEQVKLWFGTMDLAERWNVSRQAVLLWRNAGLLKFYTFGPRTFRYRLEDVEAFEASKFFG